MTNSIISGDRFIKNAYSCIDLFNDEPIIALNKQINFKIQPIEQTEEFERSKLARATDYLAAIPIIGSLFGLARIIGSAAVAAYYNLSRRSINESSSMILRAQDECVRGLWELIPFMGLYMTCHDTRPIITPGAAGKYYCKHGNELYYSMDTLKGKQIQWIQTDQIAPYKMEYRALTATFSRQTLFENKFFVKNQGRVLCQGNDKAGPLLTFYTTREIRDCGGVDWN